MSALAPSIAMDSKTAKDGEHAVTTTALQPSSATKSMSALANANISSPRELTDWVDSVLDQLESRFDSMSGQVESRSESL
jgi:hypothetical protein